jgi:glycosyltransferase involved in cell wall biosynthesis
MPVHNGGPYLREAVESILGQTYARIELIAVDDGSTDGSAEVLASYTDSRLKILTNDSNLGIVRTLNKGLAVASGEFVARMDADDVALPGRIDDQVRFLLEHPDVAVVGAAAVLIDEHGAELGTEKFPAGDREIRRMMFVHNPFIHGTVMMRKRVLDECGAYDIRFLHNEDYDLWLRIASRFKMANLPDVLLRRRIHGASITGRETPTLTGYRVKTLAHAAVSYYRNPLLLVFLARPIAAYFMRRFMN